ncbi:MAG: site-2 protease family protein [Pyrinomonadaceae bacterium]
MSESIEVIPPFVDAPAPESTVQRKGRPATQRPSAREWRRHAAFLFLTLLTTTLAGITNALNANLPEPAMRAFGASWLDYITYVPEYYLRLTGAIIAQALTEPQTIAQGTAFAFALLFILASHEAGHYIACRRYGVDVTLPFFIPAPPLLLAGTFGAFIKIRSAIPSRRALFDIGVAGPIAGFLALLPIAFAGLLTAHAAPPIIGEQIIFNDPLLFHLIAHALGLRNLANIAPNPFYFAAWIGLLVTSLNLLPVSQLDGGHAVYALFGTRAHKWLGRATFLIVCTLAALGWAWHRSPSGFLYAVILAVLLRVRHPQVIDEEHTLGRGRALIALLTLLIFILSFMPFPITIT